MPGLVDTATVLVPLAALGLAAMLVIAAGWIHRPRGETREVGVNPLLAGVALVVGIGRFIEPLG